jgi:hypothetical protein
MSWLEAQGTGKKNARASLGDQATPSGSFAGLSMYDEPPQGDVSLEDIERCAIQRLRGSPPFQLHLIYPLSA